MLSTDTHFRLIIFRRIFMNKRYTGVLSRLLMLALTAMTLAGCGSKEGDSLDTVDPFKYVTLGD